MERSVVQKEPLNYGSVQFLQVHWCVSVCRVVFLVEMSCKSVGPEAGSGKFFLPCTQRAGELCPSFKRHAVEVLIIFGRGTSFFFRASRLRGESGRLTFCRNLFHLFKILTS